MYLISFMHLSTPKCPNVKWTYLKIFYSKQLGNTDLYSCSVFSPVQYTQYVVLQHKLGLVSRLAFCDSVLYDS